MWLICLVSALIISFSESPSVFQHYTYHCHVYIHYGHSPLKSTLSFSLLYTHWSIYGMCICLCEDTIVFSPQYLCPTKLADWQQLLPHFGSWLVV